MIGDVGWLTQSRNGCELFNRPAHLRLQMQAVSGHVPGTVPRDHVTEMRRALQFAKFFCARTRIISAHRVQ
jgi:hypothetical protein